MKKLTDLAVVSVMDLQIHTNGQTSTLEIKTHLRDLDYSASQNEVHNIVENIFNSDIEDKYERESISSKYNVYKFTEDYIDANPAFNILSTIADPNNILTQPTTTIPVIKNAIVTDPAFMTKRACLNAPILNTAQDIKGAMNVAKLLNLNVPNTTVSREPQFIFYTENHARKSGVDPESWIVLHKDPSFRSGEIHIYDKTLTSDLVRSKFTTILKCKIQDVRAKRFRNY